MLFTSGAAFVIIAPLVILYAIGYRPQASSGISRSVGVILADATPDHASISVNGTAYGTLPRSIPNIDPGMATIQITKEGYTAWEKQLEVKANQAMDIRSIQLLPSLFETTLVARNVTQFEPSPNNLLIAVTTNKNTLFVIDETGALIMREEKLGARATAISWSPDGSHILVTFPKNTYQLFRVNATSLVKIPSKEFTGFTTIHWSPTTANAIYALDKNRSLISYTVSTSSLEIVKKNINLFTVAGRTLYYQTFENELGALQLRSNGTRILAQDTGKALKKISVGSDDTVGLLFVNGELTIQNINGDSTTISPNAEDMSWSPDGKLLLVQTAPTELSIYNVANERLFAVPMGELHLITRLSGSIANPRWFPDSLHILFETNNSLVFSEIDTRDHPVSRVIDTAKATGHLTFGDKSKSIFYMQSNNKKTNLVQTWLVTQEDR